MRLNTRDEGSAVVIAIDGRLVLGDANELRDLIRTLSEQGSPAVILDLSAVTYVDSSGVGELVSAYTNVTSSGGKLVLAGLTKRVQDLLQITKLITVFPVYESTAEALAGLRDQQLEQGS